MAARGVPTHVFRILSAYICINSTQARRHSPRTPTNSRTYITVKTPPRHGEMLGRHGGCAPPQRYHKRHTARKETVRDTTWKSRIGGEREREIKIQDAPRVTEISSTCIIARVRERLKYLDETCSVTDHPSSMETRATTLTREYRMRHRKGANWKKKERRGRCNEQEAGKNR